MMCSCIFSAANKSRRLLNSLRFSVFFCVCDDLQVLRFGRPHDATFRSVCVLWPGIVSHNVLWMQFLFYFYFYFFFGINLSATFQMDEKLHWTRTCASLWITLNLLLNEIAIWWQIWNNLTPTTVLTTPDSLLPESMRVLGFSSAQCVHHQLFIGENFCFFIFMTLNCGVYRFNFRNIATRPTTKMRMWTVLAWRYIGRT